MPFPPGKSRAHDLQVQNLRSHSQLYAAPGYHGHQRNLKRSHKLLNKGCEMQQCMDILRSLRCRAVVDGLRRQFRAKLLYLLDGHLQNIKKIALIFSEPH